MTRSRTVFAAVTLAVTAAALPALNPAAGVTGPVIAGHQAGPTQFIEWVDVSGINASLLTSIGFTVAAKPGATAKASSATYSKAYLLARGYLKSGAGTAHFPVVGLYQKYTNSVSIRIVEGTAVKTLTTTVTTPAYGDTRYVSPRVVVPRNPRVALDYSYMMMKNWSSPNAPVIVDVDGEVRWVGHGQNGPTPTSTFQRNGIFYGFGTSLFRMELDGTNTFIKDYATSDHVNNIGHHNYDLGKSGILLEVNADGHQEDRIIEVDFTGTVIKTFDFATIISDAMVAGGDNPSGIVVLSSDWFHNDAATYWTANDTLVVSSREIGVFGINYSTSKIKWILGDRSKLWYTFPSLRKFALTLPVGAIAPTGQHAVSITSQGDVMMFDNGTQSGNSPGNTLPGPSRSYGAPRRYTIDEKKMTASLAWSYEHGRKVYSPICSSIYQDGKSYLIDYASEGWGTTIRLMGLGAGDVTAFEYLYPGDWSNGWNTQPVHLEAMNFA